MTTIFHNPRCQKSRQTLALLEDARQDIKVVKYLEDVPSKKELLDIIEKLGIAPIDLIRKNEAVWKENYKGKTMTEAEILTAMVENPKLIERPIVLKNNKAALGRPPANVLSIL